MNWCLPVCHICLNTFGLASLKPIMIRMAARQAIGILLSKEGIDTTATNKNMPWAIAESLVLAPAFTLAEVLTITEVIGRPPIKPEIRLPIPCACNSLFALEYLFNGSILSPASRHSSVSMLATMAIVTPTIYTLLFVSALKSGLVNCPKNSEKEDAVGSVTRWSCDIARGDPVALKISFRMIPTTTTTNAPGSALIFFKNASLLKATSMSIETTVMRMAPMCA